MNRYHELMALIDAVRFGKRDATIGKELLDFAAIALQDGLPFATQYGVLYAGRMLLNPEPSHIKHGFPEGLSNPVMAALDVARETMLHAMEQNLSIRDTLRRVRGTEEV